MRCPLCGGPLHAEDGARFVCERDHELDAEEFRLSVGAKATSALWMAIEALESEALAFRALATLEPDESNIAVAGKAEEDARILRELASSHLPPEFRPEDGSGQ